MLTKLMPKFLTSEMVICTKTPKNRDFKPNEGSKKKSQNDQFESRFGAHKGAGSGTTNVSHFRRFLVVLSPSLCGRHSRASVLQKEAFVEIFGPRTGLC